MKSTGRLFYLLTAEWLAKESASLAPGVIEVPEAIDKDVARLKLASMGIDLDVLTDAQADYLTSWEHGS